MYEFNGNYSLIYDIRDLKLSRAELDQLCLNPEISAGFKDFSFVKSYKQWWNEDYRDELIEKGLKRGVNAKYLYHLYDVSEEVFKQKMLAKEKVHDKAISSAIMGLIELGLIAILLKGKK